MTVELLNMDCMDYMAGLSDNAFDLACVDPPYGIGDVFIPISTGVKPGKLERKHKKINWNDNIPSTEYFIELKRVSKKQVVWGANYFNCFSEKGGALVWYKNNGAPSLSQCEIASLSFKKSIDYVFIQVLGGFIGNDRIHPTQKPVALYTWIFQNYAKPGQSVIDTHLGSAPSAIAAHYAGLDFVGCEIDEDYYKAGCRRFKEETRQLKLF